MMLDTIERNSFELKVLNTSEKLKTLHSSFGSSISPENMAYAAENSAFDANTAEILGLANAEQLALNKATVFQSIKGMYNGTDIYGNKTLGLNEISKWKIHPDYKKQNIKQHAGFSAEVIGTAKENIRAVADGTGTVSYRVDDLPDTVRKQFGDKFATKNDQYVDKVRINADGTYETVQTKFVGNDSKGCFDKLKSKKYSKYLEEGKVDKMEVPKDYYDDIKTKHIPQERAKLQNQIDDLKSKGNTEKAAEVEAKLESLNNLDEKLEKSLVSSNEATFATKHPNLYKANQAGLQGAKGAAELTFVVSTVDNAIKLYHDEITVKEMAKDVVADTTKAGIMGYGLGALTSFTEKSVPLTGIVTLGVSSYEDIKDFANGDISGKELAYNLGEHAVSIAGAAIGGAGFGIPGALAGSYAATKAYEAGVDFASDKIDDIADKAGEFKDMAVDKLGDLKNEAIDLKNNAGDKIADIKDAAGDKLGDLKDGAVERAGSVKSGAVKLLRKIK